MANKKHRKDNQSQTTVPEVKTVLERQKRQQAAPNAHTSQDIAASKARQQALLAAVEGQDVPTIKALIKEGADVFQADMGELSIFSRIIADDNHVALKALLSEGIKPHGDMLFEAIYAYAPKSLKLMIEADKSCLNKQNEEGKTLLMEAVMQEHEGIETLLLEHGARADIADLNGETALTLSAFSDNPNIMKNLLKFYPQLDVNALTIGKQTALMRSVAYNDIAQVKLLLEAGALAHIANQEGQTAIDMATIWKNQAIINLLKQALQTQQNEAIPAQEALAPDKADPQRACLAQQAFQAVSNRNAEKLKALLEAGLSPNALDQSGVSLLTRAVYRNDENLVALLIERGADVNKPDTCGHTPLIVAAQWEFADVLKLLLQSPNINTDYIDSLGRTALIWAAKNDNPQIIEALIKAKADLNIQDNDGDTAVIISTRHGFTRNVQLMVKSGGMIGIANKRGETAHSLASRLQKNELNSFFNECKKNVNIPGLNPAAHKIAHQARNYVSSCSVRERGE